MISFVWSDYRLIHDGHKYVSHSSNVLVCNHFDNKNHFPPSSTLGHKALKLDDVTCPLFFLFRLLTKSFFPSFPLSKRRSFFSPPPSFSPGTVPLYNPFINVVFKNRITIYNTNNPIKKAKICNLIMHVRWIGRYVKKAPFHYIRLSSKQEQRIV